MSNSFNHPINIPQINYIKKKIIYSPIKITQEGPITSKPNYMKPTKSISQKYGVSDIYPKVYHMNSLSENNSTNNYMNQFNYSYVDYGNDTDSDSEFDIETPKPKTIVQDNTIFEQLEYFNTYDKTMYKKIKNYVNEDCKKTNNNTLDNLYTLNLKPSEIMPSGTMPSEIIPSEIMPSEIYNEPLEDILINNELPKNNNLNLALLESSKKMIDQLANSEDIEEAYTDLSILEKYLKNKVKFLRNAIKGEYQRPPDEIIL